MTKLQICIIKVLKLPTVKNEYVALIINYECLNKDRVAYIKKRFGKVFVYSVHTDDEVKNLLSWNVKIFGLHLDFNCLQTEVSNTERFARQMKIMWIIYICIYRLRCTIENLKKTSDRTIMLI